jgi:hypothetical protein
LWRSETFNTIVSTSPLGLIFFVEKAQGHILSETNPYKNILTRGRNNTQVLGKFSTMFLPHALTTHHEKSSMPPWASGIAKLVSEKG